MRTKTNIFLTILRPECTEDAPQKEKILRQEYAEEATSFSNDVYNKRYTSEKVASRYKQSGRSMIEMLGVLAIIGVLTVGSIAGYSHAMHQHKLNQTKEIIAEGVNNYKIFLLEHPNELEPLLKSDTASNVQAFVDMFVKPQNFNNVSPLGGGLIFMVSGGKNNYTFMVNHNNLLTEDCINLIDWAMHNLPLSSAMVNSLNKAYNAPTCLDAEGNNRCRSISKGTKAQIAEVCRGERNYLLLSMKRSVTD